MKININCFINFNLAFNFIDNNILNFKLRLVVMTKNNLCLWVDKIPARLMHLETVFLTARSLF